MVDHLSLYIDSRSLVIVGTLDGKLRGLDPAKNGKIQWRVELSDEPLLSSSLNSVQVLDTLSCHAGNFTS